MSLYQSSNFWNKLIGEDWVKVIGMDYLAGNYMTKTLHIVDSVYVKHKEVFPAKKNIFKAFKACPADKVRVVIVGQDPYKSEISTGIPFGVPSGTKPLPPSLRVIQDALERELKGWGNALDPTLEFWAKQGVLLLNNSLTVSTDPPVGHSNLWESFVGKVVHKVTSNGGVFVVLLGKNAQQLEANIGLNNVVVALPHPSWCARTGLPLNLSFTEINKYLFKLYGEGISWVELF